MRSQPFYQCQHYFLSPVNEISHIIKYMYYYLYLSHDIQCSQPNICCIGSSTACVMVLNRETSTVYTANIGDSGFVIVRHGEVVHRSEEQQHYFNTPFQLSLPPPDHSGSVLSDRSVTFN